MHKICFSAFLLTSCCLFANEHQVADGEVQHILEILVDQLGQQRVTDFVKMPHINGRPALIVGELHQDSDYNKAALQVRDCSSMGDCVFFQEGVYHEKRMEKQVRLDSGYAIDCPLFGIESPDLIPIDLVERSIYLRHGGSVQGKINTLVILISCQTYYREFWEHFVAQSNGQHREMVAAVQSAVKALTIGTEAQRREQVMRLFEPSNALKRFDALAWSSLLKTMAISSVKYFKMGAADTRVLEDILARPNLQQLEHLRNTYLLNRRNEAFAKNIREVLENQPAHRPAVIWVGRAHVKELYTLLNEPESL